MRKKISTIICSLIMVITVSLGFAGCSCSTGGLDMPKSLGTKTKQEIFDAISYAFTDRVFDSNYVEGQVIYSHESDYGTPYKGVYTFSTNVANPNELISVNKEETGREESSIKTTVDMIRYYQDETVVAKKGVYYFREEANNGSQSFEPTDFSYLGEASGADGDSLEDYIRDAYSKTLDELNRQSWLFDNDKFNFVLGSFHTGGQNYSHDNFISTVSTMGGDYKIKYGYQNDLYKIVVRNLYFEFGFSATPNSFIVELMFKNEGMFHTLLTIEVKNELNDELFNNYENENTTENYLNKNITLKVDQDAYSCGLSLSNVQIDSGVALTINSDGGGAADEIVIYSCIGKDIKIENINNLSTSDLFWSTWQCGGYNSLSLIIKDESENVYLEWNWTSGNSDAYCITQNIVDLYNLNGKTLTICVVTN